MNEIIAGIILYRMQPDLQLLLAHPGGPSQPESDEGTWSIPRDYIETGPKSLEATKHKFEETFGFIPKGDYIDLETVALEDDEPMQAWAVSHSLPDSYIFEPFWFEMEWPPGSGQVQSFPEIDRIQYFGPFEARKKISAPQIPFISKLITSL